MFYFNMLPNYSILDLRKPLKKFRKQIFGIREGGVRMTVASVIYEVLFKHNKKFHWQFLLQVLCELQMAMLERDIDMETDVSRDIMKEDVRDIQDESYRNLRDWYIYRDYMNGLEYVIHAFDHLKNQNRHQEPHHHFWSNFLRFHKVCETFAPFRRRLAALLSLLFWRIQ